MRLFSAMVIFEEDLISSSIEEKTSDLDNINENVNIEYCFKNSLIDFHEANGYCNDEKTIFAYTETRRFYM